MLQNRPEGSKKNQKLEQKVPMDSTKDLNEKSIFNESSATVRKNRPKKTDFQNVALISLKQLKDIYKKPGKPAWDRLRIRLR